MESLNKYLAATSQSLGVEEERYGGGFRAIVAHRYDANFLFDRLGGDDFAGTQAQAFLNENPLFPSAWGKTPSEAMQKLDNKLGILYRFAFTNEDLTNWKAVPLFDLRAEHDVDPAETASTYQVQWGDILQDLQSDSVHFYDAAVDACNSRHKRNLHALVTFKYDGAFAQLKVAARMVEPRD